MESSKPAGSPVERTCLSYVLLDQDLSTNSPTESAVPFCLYESRRDIEIQSPGTASFLVDEKYTGLSSPPPVTPQQHNTGISTNEKGRKMPTRRYSREWWHSTWDRAVAKRVWPRALYIAFGVGIMTIWMGLTVHFATDQVRWDRGDDQRFAQQIHSARDSQTHTLTATASTSTASSTPIPESNHLPFFSLSGSLKSFDPVARNLHVEWSGLFQLELTDQPVPLANGTYPNTFWPMDIYRDISTVVFDATPYDNITTPNNTPADQRFYWFKIDNSTAIHIGNLGMHKWDSIPTDIAFQQNAEQSDWTTQPLFSYPFDEWKGSIVFVGDFHPDETQKTYTNASQGNYTGTNIVPFAGARLEDNSLNWRFSLNFTNECDNNVTNIKKYINESLGGDIDMDLVLNNDWYLKTVSIPCNLDITIVGTRPPLVQFAAIMAVLVNWISTIFIFVLTAESLIMRRGFMLSGTDLLGVTFTSLFALPTVRLLLPGAPEFGCLIDLVGIIPNVIIISLCITAIAVTKLNRRRRNDRDHPKGE